MKLKVDKKELEEAISYFGIEGKVVVIFRRELPYGWDGCYQTIFGIHVICVKSQLQWSYASSMIMHELCHAKQMETYGKDFDKLYDINPTKFEQEANHYMQIPLEFYIIKERKGYFENLCGKPFYCSFQKRVGISRVGL